MRSHDRLVLLSLQLALVLHLPTPARGGDELVFTDGFASGSNCAWSGWAPSVAQPLGFDLVLGTTIGGSDAIVGTCTGGDAPEQVYAVEVPDAGIVTVTLRPDIGVDLGVYVRGSCDVTTSSACSDSFGNSGVETAQVSTFGPTTLFVFVDGQSTSGGGFELDLEFADCGNGVPETGEECDDGDDDETDGCTTACQDGVVCNATEISGGDRFAVRPETGNCYVAFDDEPTTFDDAQGGCETAGGHLVTITDFNEQTLVATVWNSAQPQWIGAEEDGNDTDAIFDWVTNEAFLYTNFATNEPDDDAGSGGFGDCLAMWPTEPGKWIDTACGFIGFVSGRICEMPPS